MKRYKIGLMYCKEINRFTGLKEIYHNKTVNILETVHIKIHTPTVKGRCNLLNNRLTFLLLRIFVSQGILERKLYFPY